MRTQEMRRAIAEKVREEEATHKGANGIRTWARQNGIPMSEMDIANAVLFARQYIEHVPAIIEATEAAAKEAGLLSEAQGFLQAAEHYWFEPNDVFPDQNGLFGLIDDAYVCLSVIQQMSSNLQRTAGRPLISLDLTAANAQARHAIGEPFASQLDMIVMQIMGGPLMQTVMNALNLVASRMPTFNTPDPIWGNASPSEIANVRLGAMGVV